MQAIEVLYPKYESAVLKLQEILKTDFTNALIETFDNLEDDSVKVENDVPTKAQISELEEIYHGLEYDDLTPENRQTIFYLLSVAAINRDNLDYNLAVTPANIDVAVALVMSKFATDLSNLTVVDPVVGTGHFLYSILAEYQPNLKKNMKVIGIDNNPDLLNMADINSKLFNQDTELVLQDSLEEWPVESADVIVGEFPVGYYPNDENAKNFDFVKEEGHSFTHELLVEQIVKYLKPDGLAFLVVPAVLLQSETAANFVQWLVKKVYLDAIIDFPDDLFTESSMKKSLLVLQNHGPESKPVENILLARLGNLKDKQTLVDFNSQLNKWSQKNRN